MGRWATAPERARLWRSRPVQGEIGIVYVPEAQLFTYAQQGNTTFYAQSMQGAYRGFLDANVQADWVHLEDIAAYRLLYLPFPIMLSQATADRLREWVAAGGTLVAEGCPGYWGDRAHVGPVQPNLGLDELFGARESYVEFTPDLLGELRLTVAEHPVWGGIFLQAYHPTTGTPVGWYEDGQVAAVDHRYGQGRTRLIGTMLGAGHAAHGERDPLAAPFFTSLLAWAGVEPHVRVSDGHVKVRLHAGDGGTYLWVANPTRQARPVRIELGACWGPIAGAETLWGAETTCSPQVLTLVAPPRDVTVLELRSPSP